ncbi:hypothetical protein DAPPUDRAFT_111959 [Daphnia pulex]|uniref:Uncharacterized protein n=1 Tax=Daphnia pulex TaxID=6669 RepID=E9HAK6_DAPPU|nr:hypothetical protein DAPPUDRAFT_111959 [Daphnia pulex]|eukprot:EFX71197.1 hypothetical protein DAPPUDRAFT_111959 [Daphnia pulex]
MNDDERWMGSDASGTTLLLVYKNKANFQLEYTKVRSYVERSAEDMNDNMYADIELIEDYPMKPVTMFDILKRVLAQKPAPPEPTELIKTPLIRKRTCYFNAGMSHSCDYKELLQSADDANHWSSEHTPGKRRKRSSRGRAPAAASTSVPEKAAAGVVREIKKEEKELDITVDAMRVVGTSHTSRILCFSFVEKGAAICAHTQLEFSIAARELRYHIWCRSQSVTMLEALTRQSTALALYIEPCC